MESKDVAHSSFEKWHESTEKWQQSKTDMQTRTASAWSDSKDRYCQSKMEFFQRSANGWNNTKERYYQSKMELLQRSADGWNNTKDRCHQSTVGMLHRQAEKLYQSTDRMNRIAIRTSLDRIQSEPPKQLPQSMPLSQQSLPDSQPPYKQPPPEIDTESMKSSTRSPSTPTDQLPEKPNDQICTLLNTTERVFAEVREAKELRDCKASQLGEIERKWIDSTVSDAEDAARDLASLLEAYRVEQMKKGKISLSSRKRWKNNESHRALEKHPRLLVYQNRLSMVSSHLHALGVPTDSTPMEIDSKPYVPELASNPGETALVEMGAGSVPVVSELSAETPVIDRRQFPEIAELSSEFSPIVPRSVKPIPQIVVTEHVEAQPPHPASPESLHSAPPSYEVSEMNEMLAWRNSKNTGHFEES
ncbi:hypothetical protein NUU61_009143 [Penicillium alfredii]|uniref:Uncharacterized protein n=1 Tax=Penicillium alfredii TaxID=1506179 RepID=A0A9W9EMS6_9EURO|nr:uncharacterized protein NUU61_009143 [Penicillium alfredii]KAJ5084564.1 hypothetical protein NUU61_009143 [Penicillium alfredii]